ncbi:MAG: hypothetical protein WAS73_02030 [Defluviicoccus sp.]
MTIKDEMYKEVGTNYRFFLGWRHAALAGYVLVFGAVLSLCISAFKDASQIVWIIPFSASPIGLALWAIDRRTRDLYHATLRAGRQLEAPEKGFYTLISEEVALPPGSNPFRKVTQTGALNAMFIGGSLALAGISLFLFIAYGGA